MTISPADLLKLRSTPHRTKLYLIVQQAQWRDSGAWTGYDWSGTLTAAPGTTNDELAVTSANGLTLLDGMTVLIDSTETGGRDRGTFRVHGDQTIGAGAETLYIHESGELGDVQIGDKVVAIDEFRYWPRYPKTTEAAGTLTWYKDWGYFRDSLAADGLLWSQLGGTAAARREAVYPPTPIMGPHRVAFIDPDVGSVDVDFDWSDSYTLSPGATVNAWAGDGEGSAGWPDANENPGAKTYTGLSGLAGYRTTLEVLSDVQDPIVEFRRGVRYVFTLRRPDQYQDGSDPTPRAHYVPIEDFEVSTISGNFAAGSWSTSIRIFGSAAAETSVQPGALVIVFAEDWYAGTKENLGPIDGAENIVVVGHIADGTIVQDSETGDVTFDIISLAEQASRRENYPVPITNNDTATEWTDAPDLTISRAAWWFTAWHSMLPLITDVYADIELNGASDTREIAGQDFLAGDLFRASLDNFLQARVVGRVLMDRYERAAFVIDRQVQTAGGASTLFDLASGDWIGQAQLREINEPPANIVEAGGVNYNAGVITPYLSIAPGSVSGYRGTNQASNNLAVTGQAQLNTISGDLYAYANNRWSELILQMAGTWRFGDLWPQEYIDVDLALVRYTLTNADFLVRGVSFDFDPAQGAMFTTYRLEYETDGPDGITVDILTELEPTTGNTETPPEKPPGFNGTALVATDDGVWWTQNLLDDDPSWVEPAEGLTGLDARYVWALVQDPNNPLEWWAGTNDGIYYTSDLLGGTAWTQLLSLANIDTIATVTSLDCRGIGFCALLPGYVVAVGETVGGDLWVIDNKSNGASSTVGDWRGRGIGGDSLDGGQTLAVSQHLDAGNTEPRCVVIGISTFGFLFIEDTQDTSGAWTNYVANNSTDVYPITFWESTTYDDDDGILLRQEAVGGTSYIRKVTTFLDAGVPVTTNVGDAGMATVSTFGVVMWADIENVFWFVAGDDDMWYSDDGGTTWSTWGDAFAIGVAVVAAADGDTSKGFIINPFAEGSGDPIVIEYNGDATSWVDKTGDLDVVSSAEFSRRIYLLDV
jgi:hypothetical protein